jgi:hypothetical protein
LDDSPALWVTHPRFGSERLSYDGLRGIIHRRSSDAVEEEPSLHDFRRAFALAMLRNGTDVYTLAKLMGHEGITVLQRYFKQTYQEIEAAHRRAGPVDNSNLLGLVVGGGTGNHPISIFLGFLLCLATKRLTVEGLFFYTPEKDFKNTLVCSKVALAKLDNPSIILITVPTTPLLSMRTEVGHFLPP